MVLPGLASEFEKNDQLAAHQVNGLVLPFQALQQLGQIVQNDGDFFAIRPKISFIDWANPEIFSKVPSPDTLQIQSISNPMYDSVRVKALIKARLDEILIRGKDLSVRDIVRTFRRKKLFLRLNEHDSKSKTVTIGVKFKRLRKEGDRYITTWTGRDSSGNPYSYEAVLGEDRNPIIRLPGEKSMPAAVKTTPPEPVV